MHLDLRQLQAMHPLLDLASANDYAHKAAVGLGRHGHEPGARMPVTLDQAVLDPEPALQWTPAAAEDAAQLDKHKVTEDAAEAIALALVHGARGWVVRRRLQRGEFADWLLMDGARNLVALEVSGVDRPDGGARMRIKREQVAQCSIRPIRVACVVTLATPCTTIEGVKSE